VATGGAARRFAFGLLFTAVATGLTSVNSARPVFAAGAAQNQLVSANPADWTPQVVDDPGSIRELAQTGNAMIAGGGFSQVQNAGSSVRLTRNNIFAFNATSGDVSTSFVPSIDGLVRSVAVSANGAVVYAGGEFKRVNGVSKVSLVALNLSNGSINGAFQVPALDGYIWSMKVSNGKLYIAGGFRHVGGRPIAYLARLDAITGAVDTSFNVSISGRVHPDAASHPGWVTHLVKVDITPNGRRLVFAGDYTTVNGVYHPQIAQLDISNTAPRLVDWQTDRFGGVCKPRWENWVTDVMFSPDGTYFAVSAGGGYNGDQQRGCDSSSRWPTFATGSQLQPAWIDFTGGDTLWSVAATGTAIYTGGHNRWQNNPFGQDSAGAGAVDRPGLAALDPKTGVPFGWNPGRTLGVGVYDLLATNAGLWIGHDTNVVGGETHKKLAFFPLSGGSVVGGAFAGGLPSNVVQLGRNGATIRSVGSCGSASTGGDDSGSKRSFDGSHSSSQTSLPPQGTAWGQARGAFMVSGVHYSGWANGSLCRRMFNGSTFASPHLVDLHGNKFGTELKTITAMFFSNNRIYFTKSGMATLYYRYFVPQSEIVGASRFTASGSVTGLDFSKVSGMFVASGKLYFVTRTNGVLHRVDWNGSKPVPGTAVAISGPSVDSKPSWNSQALTLYAS
jgi:hypothetical protein